MSGRQETVDDILAEMRMALKPFPYVYSIGRRDAPAEFDANGLMTKPRSIVIENVTVPELCSRIEAAMKREKYENAKMRKALEKIAHYCDDENAMDDPFCADGITCAKIAISALAILQGEKA